MIPRSGRRTGDPSSRPVGMRCARPSRSNGGAANVEKTAGRAPPRDRSYSAIRSGRRLHVAPRFLDQGDAVAADRASPAAFPLHPPPCRDPPREAAAVRSGTAPSRGRAPCPAVSSGGWPRRWTRPRVTMTAAAPGPSPPKGGDVQGGKRAGKADRHRVGPAGPGPSSMSTTTAAKAGLVDALGTSDQGRGDVGVFDAISPPRVVGVEAAVDGDPRPEFAFPHGVRRAPHQRDAAASLPQRSVAKPASRPRGRQGDDGQTASAGSRGAFSFMEGGAASRRDRRPRAITSPKSRFPASSGIADPFRRSSCTTAPSIFNPLSG
jgi:hypothetical protein